METETINLVASTQSYSITGKVKYLKRIEVSYDGTNWYRVNVFDINERSSDTSTTSISADCSKTKPYADVYEDDGTFKVDLYPIPDAAVTNGLKVWKAVDITDLSADTDSPCFATSCHKGLCYGAAKDFAEKRNPEKAPLYQAQLERYIVKAKEFYMNRTDRDYLIQSAETDYDWGSELL